MKALGLVGVAPTWMTPETNCTAPESEFESERVDPAGVPCTVPIAVPCAAPCAKEFALRMSVFKTVVTALVAALVAARKGRVRRGTCQRPLRQSVFVEEAAAERLCVLDAAEPLRKLG